MWQTISNISAIVTCFLFVLYIVGHIWKVIVTRQTKYEKFEVQRFENDDEYDNVLILDEVGATFSLSSVYGIRNIKIYNVEYDYDDNGNMFLKSKKLRTTYENLNVNEELYIKCNLGEFVPIVQFEIERADYTKVTFDLIESGKTGNILTGNITSKNYGFKMTFKSFLYYLCI